MKRRERLDRDRVESVKKALPHRRICFIFKPKLLGRQRMHISRNIADFVECLLAKKRNVRNVRGLDFPFRRYRELLNL